MSISRIAGILGPAAGEAESLVERMLRTQQSRPQTPVRRGRIDRAELGVIGEGFHQSAGSLAVFDGHIYNRSELGGRGTDAELLVDLTSRHGFEGALQRINGDFAAALYDATTETLWLGRDRFGVRPLYYAETGNGIAFASRPRALLSLPGISRRVNRTFAALFAASHYRHFDHRPDHSAYQDLSQLPAGHVLRIAGGRSSLSAYWRLEDLPDFEESEGVLAERYRALFLDAVRIRLAAARKPAFTLSGGMDSSSIAASAARLSGGKVAAISTVYDDPLYDESKEIHGMGTSLVDPWIRVRIGTPDIFALVGGMVEAHDEPVATATWLSHYLLCKEARGRGHEALFGGLGGDELNAGEYEHFFFFFADLKHAGREQELDLETERWIAYHDHPLYRKSREVMRDAVAQLADLNVPGSCRPNRPRLLRYRSALRPEFFALEKFDPPMDRIFSSYLKNRTCQDLIRETIPCCLRAEDRNAAAFDLDHFLPFLDHRLVEFMFRVPGTLKIRRGVTKHLLREAMREILPEETRTRIQKVGWNAPAHVWFSGPGREALLDLVRSRSFRERGIYVAAEVERLILEHDRIVSTGEIRENHMMFLWQLLNLELWLRSGQGSL